jgi:hypothetical protein
MIAARRQRPMGCESSSEPQHHLACFASPVGSETPVFAVNFQSLPLLTAPANADAGGKGMKREGSFDLNDVFKSAAHWRMRAEEMRTIAGDALDPKARAMMLRIAADYERLAKHADDRAFPMMVRDAAD